jgi:hypothetical protein
LFAAAADPEKAFRAGLIDAAAALVEHQGQLENLSIERGALVEVAGVEKRYKLIEHGIPLWVLKPIFGGIGG